MGDVDLIAVDGTALTGTAALIESTEVSIRFDTNSRIRKTEGNNTFAFVHWESTTPWINRFVVSGRCLACTRFRQKQ